jgi:hypothetical protein
MLSWLYELHTKHICKAVTSEYCLLLPKYNAMNDTFPLSGRMPLLEQEVLTLLVHISAPLVFSGVRVTRSLVLCVCFVDCCLSFCPFSFGHCVVCPFSIYGDLIISLVSLNSSYHCVCNKSNTTGVNIGTGTAYILEFNPDFSCGSICSVCSSSYCFWSPWHLQAFLTPIKSMKHIWILKYSKVSNLDLWKYVCINIKLHVCTCKTSGTNVNKNRHIER